MAGEQHWLDRLIFGESEVEFTDPLTGRQGRAPVSEGGLGWGSVARPAVRWGREALRGSRAGRGARAASRSLDDSLRHGMNPARRRDWQRAGVAAGTASAGVGAASAASRRGASGTVNLGGGQRLADQIRGATLPARAPEREGPRSFEDVVGPRSPEQTFSQQLQALTADFAAHREALADMFALAETPEEQARLAFVLGDLEQQEIAGRQIIADQFSQAQRFAASQAGQMRQAAAAEGQAMQGVYQDAAQGAAAGIDSIAGEFAGTGTGAGAVPVSGDATDWIGLIESQGAAQGALTSQLGSIAADDQAWLSQQLGQEGAAQQGALQRAALQARAAQIAAHQQQVADRINQNQMSMVDTFLRMQSDSRNQDDGYEQDRRDYEIAMEMRRLEQEAAGGPEAMVPTDPREQVMFVGQLLAENPTAGPDTVRALVRQGALPREVLEFFPDLLQADVG